MPLSSTLGGSYLLWYSATLSAHAESYLGLLTESLLGDQPAQPSNILGTTLPSFFLFLAFLFLTFPSSFILKS